MEIIQTLPEEAELEFRMRYSGSEWREAHEWFLGSISLEEFYSSKLVGYIECIPMSDRVIVATFEGKSYLPLRVMLGVTKIPLMNREHYPSLNHFTAKRFGYNSFQELASFKNSKIFVEYDEGMNDLLLKVQVGRKVTVAF